MHRHELPRLHKGKQRKGLGGEVRGGLAWKAPPGETAEEPARLRHLPGCLHPLPSRGPHSIHQVSQGLHVATLPPQKKGGSGGGLAWKAPLGRNSRRSRSGSAINQGNTPSFI